MKPRRAIGAAREIASRHVMDVAAGGGKELTGLTSIELVLVAITIKVD